MKTFATILFATCLLSQLALSVRLKDFEGFPRELLEYAVHTTESHLMRVKRLMWSETTNTSKDIFVVKKDADVASFPRATEDVEDELSMWKDAILSATKNEEKRLEIFNRRRFYFDENKSIIFGVHVDLYVLWDKYRLSDIAECVLEAHAKFTTECFENGRAIARCAVYYFACGFALHDSSPLRRSAGESDRSVDASDRDADSIARIGNEVDAKERAEPSTGLNDLSDAIGEIGDKLDAKDQVMFSLASPVVKRIFRASPQKILAHVVNSESYHWEQANKLFEIEKSCASKDAFVVIKSKDTASVLGSTASIIDELSQWKDAILSATRNEDERLKILNSRRYDTNINYIEGDQVDAYVFWDKYTLAEIAACVNGAHDKVAKECFANGKALRKCSVYYFACGFKLTAFDRISPWIVGESDIFARR